MVSFPSPEVVGNVAAKIEGFGFIEGHLLDEGEDHIDAEADFQRLDFIVRIQFPDQRKLFDILICDLRELKIIFCKNNRLLLHNNLIKTGAVSLVLFR